MRNRTRFVGLLLLAVVAACQGDMGPMGPEGEQGAQGFPGWPGENGQGVEYFLGSGVIDSAGGGVVTLPEEAGSAVELPLVTCYVGPGFGAWRIVSTEGGSASCKLVWAGSLWHVVIEDAPPGWVLAVVAVWKTP